MQEITLASNATFLCGVYCIEWEVFSMAARLTYACDFS